MLQYAGLINVIRTILIIVAIYYGLRIILRYLFPFLIKRFVNKTMSQQGFEGSFNQRTQSKSNSNTKSKSPKHDELGDYVDFEEIDE